jgi:hypothetical protein
LLRTLLVTRLVLSPLVANDTLILCAGRWQLRPWHTFLAAMLAALILHAFQIVFPGHSAQPFAKSISRPVNAIRCRRVPSMTRKETRPVKTRQADLEVTSRRRIQACA